MPVYLEAVRELAKKLGDRVTIRGTGTGPFSIAAYLYGIEDFLIKLAEIHMGVASKADVEGYHTLLEITSDTSIAFLKAQIEAGEHLVYLGDSLSSLNMISPSMYRNYVFPWHKKVFEGVRDHCKKYETFTLLHACGDNTKLLEDYIKTGVDMYEVDSMMDLKTCKDIVGNRLSLIGNLHPTDIVLNGSIEDVERESQRCIDVAAQGGGFILGTGCFVPLMSPLENLQQMVKIGHRYHYN
jgi:uroporphyrinogen decarboxylase